MEKVIPVTKEELHKIIDIRIPKGLFYLEDNNTFIACDNSTGDAWTEEFKTYAACQKYLLRL